MEPNELANLEQDSRFPSGPWTGFFLQYWLPGRQPTNLDLVCECGELSGTGRDRVGRYTVDGTYDLATGRCEWTKQYIGKHSVEYRGMSDGRGIWGVWEIRQLAGLFVDRGGFHIWPEGADASEESEQTEQAVLAVMRREFGSPLYRILRLLLILTALASLFLLLRSWTGGET
jgi:hypothetical protein